MKKYNLANSQEYHLSSGKSDGNVLVSATTANGITDAINLQVNRVKLCKRTHANL
jgi:hypothetical protein